MLHLEWLSKPASANSYYFCLVFYVKPFQNSLIYPAHTGPSSVPAERHEEEGSPTRLRIQGLLAVMDGGERVWLGGGTNVDSSGDKKAFLCLE